MKARALRHARSLSLAAVVALCLMTSNAFATCSTPAGNEGDVLYTSVTHQMVYCNGTVWLAMGQNSAVSFGTLTPTYFCTATSGTAIQCNTNFTGSNNVVLSGSPILTGTVAGANSTWTGQVAIGTTTLSGALNVSGTATATTFSGSGASLTSIGTASLGGITGSASATTYLTGNGTWSTPAASLPSLTSTDVWVGNTSNVATATATTGTGNVVMSASPTLTGTPTAPTQATADTSIDIATDAFVHAVVNALPALTSSAIISALGFTPYNASNPSGYISGVPTTFNTVGTYALAFGSGLTISPGGTISGSSLTYVNMSSGSPQAGGSLSGTWRMMGGIGGNTTNLWLRIS